MRIPLQMASSTPKRDLVVNSTGHGIAAVTISLAVLATVTCGGRFWARKLTGLDWSWDDWLALASLLVNHVFMAFTVNAALNGGLGQSLNVLVVNSPESVVIFLKSVLGSEFSYGLSSPLIKLSLLAFYWRMFPTPLVRRGVLFLSIACLMWAVVILVINLLECRPLSYLWNQLAAPESGTCINLVLYFLSNSVANSLIDILTLALPVHEVMKLQMSRNKKVGIICVFALGSIVVVASLVRLGSLAELYVIGVTDMTLQYALMWTATLVEIYVAIIGACIVTLVPVYRKLRTGSPWSTKRSGGSSDWSRSGRGPGGPGGASGGSVGRLSVSNHRRAGGASAAGHYHQKRAGPAGHQRLGDGDSEEYLRATEDCVWRDTKIVGKGGVRTLSTEDVPLEGIMVRRDVVCHQA